MNALLLLAAFVLSAVPAAAQNPLPKQAPGEPTAAKPGILRALSAEDTSFVYDPAGDPHPS